MHNVKIVDRVEAVVRVPGFARNREQIYQGSYVEYGSGSDLLWKVATDTDALRDYTVYDSEWTGGTKRDFRKRALMGNTTNVARSAKLMRDLTNSLVSDYHVDMDWNQNYGVLDYEMAVNGHPDCYYGTTMTETDRSPITIITDPSPGWNVSATGVRNRGVATMALATVLATYRPVSVYMVDGSESRSTNCIQAIKVPTNPLDMARACWMLCDTDIIRVGFFSYIKHTYDGGIGFIDGDATRQSHCMGQWISKIKGLDYEKVIYIPCLGYMDHFENEAKAESWVREHLDQWMPKQTG